LRENHFLLKNFVDGFKPFTFWENSYLNTDMCKFESSQKDKTEPSRLIPQTFTATLVSNGGFFSINMTHVSAIVFSGLTTKLFKLDINVSLSNKCFDFQAQYV